MLKKHPMFPKTHVVSVFIRSESVNFPSDESSDEHQDSRAALIHVSLSFTSLPEKREKNTMSVNNDRKKPIIVIHINKIITVMKILEI